MIPIISRRRDTTTMHHQFVLLLVSLLLTFIHTTHAVLFSTKPVLGSTCLHHLESGSTMLFDRGQMAEMVMASTCLQITQRGVRFISSAQHLRDLSVSKNWQRVDCIQNGRRIGSLCAIPGPLNTFSEVLPCSPSTYTPICGKEANIDPMGLKTVLESVPRDERQCTSAGDTSGLRTILPNGGTYDITQCDLHSVGLSMVFVNPSSTLYITHGLELEGYMYTLSGICVVIVVACITQNIVFITGSSNKKPNGWVCLGVSIASFVLVLSTMEGYQTTVLVTMEELFAFWYMISYCILRFMGIIYNAHQTTQNKTKFYQIYHETILHGDYYNLLVCSLQLLATRVHLTMSTPYTTGITFLVGARLFWKIRNSYSIPPKFIHLAISMADAMMVYTLCLAGVLPLFSSLTEGYAVCIVLVFACISASRVLPDQPLQSVKEESKKS